MLYKFGSDMMFVLVSISKDTAIIGLFSDAASGPTSHRLCYDDYRVSLGDSICSATGLGVLKTTRLIDSTNSTGPWLKAKTDGLFELTTECNAGKIVGLECQEPGNFNRVFGLYIIHLYKYYMYIYIRLWANKHVYIHVYIYTPNIILVCCTLPTFLSEQISYAVPLVWFYHGKLSMVL